MIEKVISGGQIGADQAGLEAATICKIPTGGHAPKNYLTKTGPNPILLKKYGLIESSGGYKIRTGENVKNSDGTIRLATNFNSPGEICTRNAIRYYKKPFFDVDLNNPKPVEEVVEWIFKNNIKVLNVAGNTNANYNQVVNYLTNVFKEQIQ